MDYTTIDSPVGPLLLAGRDETLSLVGFVNGWRPQRPDPSWTERPRSFRLAIEELRRYFAQKLEAFSVPLSLEGTPFQLRVWHELQDIAYGETISYGELARRVGNPQAARAVGLANGANPISIIIPCHRVIGSNGTLTGYGGGLEIKQQLLALERRQLRLI